MSDLFGDLPPLDGTEYIDWRQVVIRNHKMAEITVTVYGGPAHGQVVATVPPADFAVISLKIEESHG
jgi:hypothetical protein